MKRIVLILVMLFGCSGESPSFSSPSSNSCGLSTEYSGDEACISSADIHFGPTDYDDPAEIERFLVEPGSDGLFVEEVKIPSERFVGGYVAGVRSAIHHLNLVLRTEGTPNFSFRKSEQLPGIGFSSINKSGAPVSFSEEPDFPGAAIEIPANARSFAFDIHTVNTTDHPELVEGWVDLEFLEVPTTKLAFFRFSGGLSMVVPPKTTATVRTGGGETCLTPSTLSIVSVSGHQHRHGRGIRLAILSDPRVVYSETDYQHPHRAVFTSAHENPEEDRSGKLTLGYRTPMSWECDIENTLATEIKYGSNIATAEMCALSGFFTSDDPKPWSCVTQ